jgi:hypothetical protein
MNIKTATKKELRQADIDAVQRKAKEEFNQVKMEIYKNILKDLDSCMEKATAIHSKILNNRKLWDKDEKFAQEVFNKSFLACDEIQSARMECQDNIMKCIMIETSDEDYNEYEYNRDVDSQADEENALASIGWGEEW